MTSQMQHLYKVLATIAVNVEINIKNPQIWQLYEVDKSNAQMVGNKKNSIAAL